MSGSGVIGLVIASVIVLLGVFLVPKVLASDSVYTEPIEFPGTNGNPFMPPPSAPPETPESRPEPLPQPEPNTVPSGFIGTWTGSVTQDNYARSPYPVTVQITGGGVGQTVATGQYPSLECQAHWTLKQTRPGESVIRETVDQGPECVNTDVTLTLLANGTMRYIFDDGLGRSVLQRVS